MYKPSFISLNDTDYRVLQLLQLFFVTQYCLYDLSPYDQVTASNTEASSLGIAFATDLSDRV
jgi:hypothetical protein